MEVQGSSRAPFAPIKVERWVVECFQCTYCFNLFLGLATDADAGRQSMQG